jgi:hypothetical protein
VAALIAGLVAFFSLIISKEQTVSGFRQRWIDALREDIAAVTSCVSGIHGESIVITTGNQALWERVKPDVTSLKAVIARIRLRLNPDEKGKKEGPATRAVLEALSEIESLFASADPQFHKLGAVVTELVKNARVILKENWRRVRSGEPVYKIAKWSALGLTLLFVVLSVIALLYHRSAV